MTGRWESQILLLCELLVCVSAETVAQQREEEQDENKGLQVPKNM